MKNPLITLALGLATTLLLTQCDRPDDPAPPAKLLPRDEMVRLLIDLHLTEARVEAARMQPDSARVLFRQQAKDLYQRHHTDETTFEESMRYYAIHGKDLEEIYGTVVDSISMRQAQLPGQ